MHTIELIRHLSPEGAKNFAAALRWLNPLPADGSGVLDKIDLAVERLDYAQNRQGSTPEDDTSSQRASLANLRAEIASLLTESS